MSQSIRVAVAMVSSEGLLAMFRAANVPPPRPMRKQIAALTPAKSDFQPFLAHGRIGAEILRLALEHDAAVAHDEKPVGNLQRDAELLLDQQNRDAPA